MADEGYMKQKISLNLCQHAETNLARFRDLRIYRYKIQRAALLYLFARVLISSPLHLSLTFDILQQPGFDGAKYLVTET